MALGCRIKSFFPSSLRVQCPQPASWPKWISAPDDPQLNREQHPRRKSCTETQKVQQPAPTSTGHLDVPFPFVLHHLSHRKKWHHYPPGSDKFNFEVAMDPGQEGAAPTPVEVRFAFSQTPTNLAFFSQFWWYIYTFSVSILH